MACFRPTRFFARSAGVLLIAAALAITELPAKAGTADVTARNEAIVREAFESWAGGRYVFGELLAPDVVWTIHGSGPVAGTYTNMETFVERAARPLTSRLASPLVPEVHNIWAVDDRVIVRWGRRRTHDVGGHLQQPVRLDPPDGERARCRGGSLSRSRGLPKGRGQQRAARGLKPLRHTSGSGGDHRRSHRLPTQSPEPR